MTASLEGDVHLEERLRCRYSTNLKVLKVFFRKLAISILGCSEGPESAPAVKRHERP
jgi:hypothetical protein